jgi:hypothetical protein
MKDRFRVEPMPPMPLKKGKCDWCGCDTKAGASYCNKDCRVAYNNLLARQGKTIVQMLKVWRLHRGGKGTPGEGMIGQIAARVDRMLEEDRDRKASQ